MKLNLFEDIPQIYEIRLNDGDPQYVTAFNPISAIEQWYRDGYPGVDLPPIECEFMGICIVQCFVGDDEIKLQNITKVACDGMRENESGN